MVSIVKYVKVRVALIYFILYTDIYGTVLVFLLFIFHLLFIYLFNL